MPPSGLAMLIGAGPATGAGIARVLASQGNLAVALLARNPDSLRTLAQSLRTSVPHSTIETFPADTQPQNLSKAFKDIRAHDSFKGLKLKVAIYSIKNADVKPFLEETHEAFMNTLSTYVGGAMAFSQEAIKLLFEHHGEKSLADGGEKKGTIIFTGTLGALRTNAKFASYGSSRASVKMVSQAVGKEFSPLGIQNVHVVANGRIEDKAGEDQRSGKRMSAEAVGKTYLWLSEQEPTLWTSELDLRPAQEKY